MSDQRQSNRFVRFRRLALVVALTGSSTALTGCSSGPLAGMNPLTKTSATPTVASTPTTASTPADAPGVTSGITRFAQGTRNQASSVGMAVKSAYDKSVNSVAGVLGSKASATDVETGQAIAAEDPLLLGDKPTNVGPEVFVANGQLWESTGNFDRALDNYSKALEKEPNNSPALASIARLHYRQEQYGKAVDFFQKAIQSSPEEAGLYNDLGLTLSQIGRHDEAVVAMNKSISLAPGTSRYANNLATVQFQAGREEDARATLLKYNTPAVAHYNMAYLQYSSQRTDKALQELGKVLSISETAGTDSASKRAIVKSKELFEKLGGPATQIAQSLPHLYGNVKQSGQAVSQLATDATQVFGQVRSGAAGITAQFSDSVAPVAGATIASNPVTTATATATPNATAALTTNQFAMPSTSPPTTATTATPNTTSTTTGGTSVGGFVMPDILTPETTAERTETDSKTTR